MCSRGGGGRGRGIPTSSFGPTGFEEWGGYMNAKRQKLMDQFDRDSASSSNVVKKSDIFDGVRIFVNGFTSPPASDLRLMMMEHGGVFHTYFVKDLTTHVVVSSMANSKQKIFDKQKCVGADWITQSVQAGRLLDWRQFQFKSGVVKGQKNASEFFAAKCEAKLESVVDSSKEEQSQDDQEEDMMVDGLECEDEEEEGEGMDDETMEAKENVPNLSLPSIVSNATHTGIKTGVILNNNNNGQNGSAFSTIGRPQDPNFISEFFKNSRLHLISQLGAEWKEYVRKLQEEGDSREYPGRKKLCEMVVTAESGATPLLVAASVDERVIMHIDMDCFFVSVGLRSRPDLRGKPVAVTHSRSSGVVKARPGSDLALEKRHYEMKRDKPLKSTTVVQDAAKSDEDPFDIRAMKDPSLTEMSTSEIASCSYEARSAGVKNGTFLGAAKRLCPDLVTIPYDFEGYRNVSKILYDVVASYTCRIEAVSCDECFVDLTDLVAESRLNPLAVASVIREDIRSQTQCPASTGLGPNLLVARLATRLAKPDGQFRVSKAEVVEFIRRQPVGDLPGVGRATASKFTKMGVATCGDLQGRPQSALLKEFGAKQGAVLFKLCRGEDDRPIDACKVRKSVSVDVNYGIRFERENEPYEFLDKLAAEMETRMKNLGVKGKMISLKVLVRSKDAPIEPAKYGGHGIVDHLHKSSSLSHFVNNAAAISRETHHMLKAMHTLDGNAIPARDIRGVGITFTKLDNQQQQTVSGLRDISSFIRKRVSSGSAECSVKGLQSQQPTALVKVAPSQDKENIDSQSLANGCSAVVPIAQSAPAFRDNVVNLITVAKVKPLMKEWLSSGLEPCEEDVDFACALLLTCIYEHDALQCVFSLCKMFLRRMNDGAVTPIWRAALDAIIQVVQDAVEEECGHPFLLN